MIIATLRLVDERAVTVEGDGLEEIQTKLLERRPAGYELVSAPVSMDKGSTMISATGTYASRETKREISGESMDEIQSQVPEGWKLLHVRSV